MVSREIENLWLAVTNNSMNRYWHVIVFGCHFSVLCLRISGQTLSCDDLWHGLIRMICDLTWSVYPMNNHYWDYTPHICRALLWAAKKIWNCKFSLSMIKTRRLWSWSELACIIICSDKLVPVVSCDNMGRTQLLTSKICECPYVNKIHGMFSRSCPHHMESFLVESTR